MSIAYKNGNLLLFLILSNFNLTTFFFSITLVILQRTEREGTLPIKLPIFPQRRKRSSKEEKKFSTNVTSVLKYHYALVWPSHCISSLTITTVNSTETHLIFDLSVKQSTTVKKVGIRKQINCNVCLLKIKTKELKGIVMSLKKPM